VSSTGQVEVIHSAAPASWRRWLAGTENLVLTLAFALIVLLPLAEIRSGRTQRAP